MEYFTVCEGWMGFVLVGALVTFLAGLFSWVLFPKCGVDVGMVVCTVCQFINLKMAISAETCS